MKFERPQLFPEKAEKPIESPAVPSDDVVEDETEDWREETVAEIFDSAAPGSTDPRPQKHFGDLMLEWLDHKRAEEREERARGRRSALERLRLRRDGSIREHVFAGGEARMSTNTCSLEKSLPFRAAHRIRR